MTSENNQKLVFLFDVDNTLINNDQVKTDVENQMKALVGDQQTQNFWQAYEEVRHDLDVVDIPETLKRVEPEFSDKALYQGLHDLWMKFPYHNYIYPSVFQVLDYVKSFAQPVILTDGDTVFQLYKVSDSGLGQAVDSKFLIYKHKDRHFAEISQTYPADHYVMVEDKPSLLTEGKNYFEERVTTVLVLQGKYSKDAPKRKTDITINSIADLLEIKPEQFA